MRSVCVAVAVLAGLATLPAGAQEAPLEIPAQPESTVPAELQGMIGPWVLEQEDPALPVCALGLTDAESAGGWAVALPASCVAPFPPATGLVSWNIDSADGSVILLDANGQITLRLYEDEDGLYASDPDTPPHFYLLPPYDEDLSGGEADD